MAMMVIEAISHTAAGGASSKHTFLLATTC